MREGEGSRHARQRLKELGRDCSWLIVDGLAVAYAPEPDALAPKSLAKALEHARVIAELHAIETVIPLRYGTGVAGAEQLETLLRSRHSELLAALDAVDGCHEFSVCLCMPALRGVSDPFHAKEESSGTAYLLARRDHVAAQERSRALAMRAAAEYQNALESLAVKSRREESFNGEGYRLSLDYLVRRELGDAVRYAVSTVIAPTGVQARFSGPWAPYRFSQDILS